MKVKTKYFQDTDTLLIEFSDRAITETYDLNENMVVEVDKLGHIVALTVEHAKEQVDVHEFTYQLATA